MEILLLVHWNITCQCCNSTMQQRVHSEAADQVIRFYAGLLLDYLFNKDHIKSPLEAVRDSCWLCSSLNQTWSVQSFNMHNWNLVVMLPEVCIKLWAPFGGMCLSHIFACPRVTSYNLFQAAFLLGLTLPQKTSELGSPTDLFPCKNDFLAEMKQSVAGEDGRETEPKLRS